MPALKYAVGALRNCTPKPLSERPAERTLTLARGDDLRITATFSAREWLIRCCPDYSRLIGCRSLGRLAQWIADRPNWRVLPALVLVLLVSACGFGQIGPETLIVAETPCGRIEYRSTKDQQTPGAVCRINPDGSGYLEMGADASSGSGAVARAVAEGIVKGIGAAK